MALNPDALAIAACVVLPVIGALFVLLMPTDDRIALRHVGMATSIASGLVALVVAMAMWRHPGAVQVLGVPIARDALDALTLVVVSASVPIALRAGAPSVNARTQFYVVTLLFAQALLVSCVLVAAPVVMVALASLTAVPLFCLVALFGGPQRGTTTYRAALVWFFADAIALATLVWLSATLPDASLLHASAGSLAQHYGRMPAQFQLGIALALCAPGLVRLASGPLSVWLQSFLDDAPVSAAALAVAAYAPMGALLLVRVPRAIVGIDGPSAALLACLGAVAGIIAGIIALGERDVRRLMAQPLFLCGASVVPALIGADALAATSAVVHACAVGACALSVVVTLDAIERRFEARDSVALAGMIHSAPLLCVSLTLGLLGLVGIVGVGGGSTAWPVLLATLTAPGLKRIDALPLLPLWVTVLFAASHALCAWGVFSAMRRLFSVTVVSAHHEVTRVNTAQALRLLLPLAVALLFGAVSMRVVLALSAASVSL